ncbi:MAG: glycosyltransferase [Ruminococcus flavefaciens]|nr:glycosyltransferase [Ruminococcus flavefaciens]
MKKCNMKTVLVLVANYPTLEGGIGLMYAHVRNKYYMQHGIDVTVLNFNAEKDYEIDGIKVITLQSYKSYKPQFDILICHAANIKNHYCFLKKYGKHFPKFMFFFHGHEVLMRNHVYPKEYDYVRKNKVKVFCGDIYDVFKLKIWHEFYSKHAYKSEFVFVSKWMLEEFLKWTQLTLDDLRNMYSITYNSIGKVFEIVEYDYSHEKEYDFITIRPVMDGSKYGIDIVNNLAVKNPNLKFLVIGKGEFFEHIVKADNLMWINQQLNHNQIIEYLQRSRCALMPTRTDAQGLMMCEMASIGMPVITSNIPVCYESLGEFPNAVMIDNDNLDVDLGLILKELENNLPYQKNSKYYNENTSAAEVNLINRLYERKC